MKFAAWIVVLGSACFHMGAFLPVARFYVSSVDEKLAIMQSQPVQWMLHLAGMGIGSTIAAAGLIVFVLRLPRGMPATLGMVAASLVTMGTLLWLWHLQLRVSEPAGFAGGNNPHWHFAVYTVLMQVGLLLLAAAFRQAGLPAWMVWVLAGGTLLTVLALVAFQDVPPFLHYVWLLAVGIGLVISTPVRADAVGAETADVAWPSAASASEANSEVNRAQDDPIRVPGNNS